MEPRTIVGQPMGEGKQLRPDGIRQHHPGAIVTDAHFAKGSTGTL
jgi:hypothetical protein